MSWTTQLSRGCAALCLSLTAFAAQGAAADEAGGDGDVD